MVPDDSDEDDAPVDVPTETNPSIPINQNTTASSAAKTVHRKPNLDATIDQRSDKNKQQHETDKSEWRTRITKVQVVKPAQESDDACLVLIYPPGPEMGKRFPLARNEILMGRGADCDIQVDRDSVSRRHARVYRTGLGWSVEDLQSTNGSYVNDVPVTKSTLRDGDFVKIGAAIFKFLSGQSIEANYHEEIYKLTIVDALTGAHNKRYFIEFLNREIARCARYRGVLSLLFFDIDHFKQINDVHGHLTGDFVLREIGRRVLARVRPEELLARYGGEEFAVVLPESDITAARTFAEQIRRLIGDEPFEYEGDKIRVTVSVGVASINGEDLDPMQFCKIADDNVYRAKREGRNRVVAGEPGEWHRWKPNPAFRSSLTDKTAVAAFALLARDQLLASAGGAARVDDLEGLLSATIRQHQKGDKLDFGALEGGSKLLVSMQGRNPVHRLRVLIYEALSKAVVARPDAQFAVGPVRLTSDSPEKAIEDAVAGLDDEIGILENGRYLPQPVAIALRATDTLTTERAKFALELGETLLQWIALCACAELTAMSRASKTSAALAKNLTGGVTMGRWHQVLVTAVKELLETPLHVHDAAWRACFGDKDQRSDLFAWLGSLVEIRNAYAHGATASDEHVAKKIVDQFGPRLRQLIRNELRPVLALIPAEIELLGFEGELQSYRMTRLIGDGIPASVSTYSSRRMNPGLWLSDAIADQAVSLEPFFMRETCPKCGARELFLLTRLDELEFRNPASGHVLKKRLDDLSDDARERLVAQ